MLGSILNRIEAFAMVSAFIALAAMLTVPAPASAQGGRGGVPLTNDPFDKDQPTQSSPEASSFRDWNQEKNPDKKILLGEKFIEKYPESRYSQPVYNQLVNAYLEKQDWNKLYETSDKAIAKYPDDVVVLTTVGWVIPRLYSQDDPQRETKLDKAQHYDEHAIELLSNLPQPAGPSADQIAATRKGQLSLAHSGLGLVYFRKINYEASVKELQQATQTASSPNAIDYYALGFDLEQLHRLSEAADAYRKCSQVPGNLQAPCADSATQAESKAAAAK